MPNENKEPIRCRVILEVLGKPKEHVEKIIRTIVGRVKEDPNNSVLSEKFAEVRQQGKTMFSTFAELEILFKGMSPLIDFCFDFMPSSIEIEKPEQLTLKSSEISDFFNDLQANLHNVDMIAKTLEAERNLLRRNLSAMIGNIITILIKIGKNTREELSKFTGISEEELQKQMEKLIKEGKIKEENGFFSL